MLTLTTQDIILSQSASDKTEAIKAIAKRLTEKGYVEANYIDGMLEREAQSATYLGNGIAIPHGTVATRNLVLKTGVSVHHFPQGVDWQGGMVYVAIGIAAQSDEHLDILKQLTKALSADGVEQALKNAQTEQDIINLLNGNAQLQADFNASLVQLNFPASDMLQMSAVASGLLKNSACVDEHYISEIIAKSATYLGEGLWMTSGAKGVTRSAMSFVSTNNEVLHQNQPLKGLICFAACNASHKDLLAKLTQIIADKNQVKVLNADEKALIALFEPDSDDLSNADALLAETSLTEASAETSANTAIYTITNSHGLHARPGAMLVAEAKKFDSTIKVENLDGDGGIVNAKSLMKVIALGVSKGHRLQFSAEGADAEQAIQAIGVAIESGLGEG